MKKLLFGTLSFAALGYIYLAYLLPSILHLFGGLPPDAIFVFGFLPLGFAFGYLLPKHWLLLPLFSIALLIISAILEDLTGYKSHNLFGIELLLYGYLLLTAYLGSYLGKRLSVKNNANKYA